MSKDMWANAGLLTAALVGSLLIDAKALFGMFGFAMGTSSKTGAQSSSNPLVDLYSLHSQEGAVSLATTTVNWFAMHGLVTSALKVGLTNPLESTALSGPAGQTIHYLL